MIYQVFDETNLLELQERVKDVPKKILEHVECAYLKKDCLFLQMDEDMLEAEEILDFSSEMDILKMSGFKAGRTKRGYFFVEIQLTMFNEKTVFIRFRDLKNIK